MIGNGDGHWDVPVGGMGALTAALAQAARAAGAELRCDTEVTGVATDGAGAEVRWEGGAATAGHVLANVAPAVLARLLGEPAPEPPPEGAQLKLNMLLRRLPALRDGAVDPRDAFAGTFHVNESASQLAEAHAEASAGRIPRLPPCEVYCHSLTDPSILGPELRAAGAQTLTCFGLHMPARLFAADPDGAKAKAVEATLRSLDAVLGEPLEDCLWRTPDGEPCLEARTPVELEAELGPAGREHLPPRPRLALRGDRRAGGNVGSGDRARERAGVRGRRTPRRRRQRHPGPQRGDGRPGRARRGLRREEGLRPSDGASASTRPGGPAGWRRRVPAARGAARWRRPTAERWWRACDKHPLRVRVHLGGRPASARASGRTTRCGGPHHGALPVPGARARA